jgi:hypothetical protein
MCALAYERTNAIKWSAGEVERLKAAWTNSNIRLDDMGAHIGRKVTRSSISQKAKTLGLPPRRQALGKNATPLKDIYSGAWTREDDAILRDLWCNSDFAVVHIAARLPSGRGESAVSRRAKRIGLPNRRVLFKAAHKPRALKAKLPPPGPVIKRGCRFPVALTPRVEFCSNARTVGHYCKFHTDLMEGP